MSLGLKNHSEYPDHTIHMYMKSVLLYSTFSNSAYEEVLEEITNKYKYHGNPYIHRATVLCPNNTQIPSTMSDVQDCHKVSGLYLVHPGMWEHCLCGCVRQFMAVLDIYEHNLTSSSEVLVLEEEGARIE